MKFHGKQSTITSNGLKNFRRIWAELHLYRDFLQQSEKTDELLAYVTKKYPTDEKLLALVEKLEILEEKWKLVH